MSHLENLTVAEIAKQHADVVAGIRQCDPIQTMAIFAGLLSQPDLQANCDRLETLLHLSCTYGAGAAVPEKKQIADWFAALHQGPSGWREDPSEDVFVTLVSTPHGNFRVFPGIWENAAFYLQRMLNAIERVQPQDVRKEILRPVEALLLLSDEVCQRAGIQRYTLGEATPRATIPNKIADAAVSNSSLVRFEPAELERLGITLGSLAPFGFIPSHRLALASEFIGHSMLERTPLGFKDDTVYLLLPTSVTAAIRRYLFEFFVQHGQRDLLIRLMEAEYQSFFLNLPLFGGKPAGSVQISNTDIVSLLRVEDVGQYLHFVFILDDMEGFETRGLIGQHPVPNRMLSDIKNSVETAYNQAKANPEFVGITTILCGCGIGRAVPYPEIGIKRSNWRCQPLSAADLATLSFTTGFDPLVLIRLLNAEKLLASSGVELMNVNGLLNLAAWSKEFKGHLVPHADLPEEFQTGARMLALPQNSLRELRHEVAVKSDEHRALNPGGELVPVRKGGASLFSEETRRPLYVGSEFHPKTGLPLVYEADRRNWWAELSVAESASANHVYQRWLLVETWLGRIAPVLDRELNQLPHEPVLWRCVFDGNIGDREEPAKMSSYESALASITIVADQRSPTTVVLRVGEEFEKAIYHAENIAEKALGPVDIHIVSRL